MRTVAETAGHLPNVRGAAVIGEVNAVPASQRTRVANVVRCPDFMEFPVIDTGAQIPAQPLSVYTTGVRVFAMFPQPSKSRISDSSVTQTPPNSTYGRAQSAMDFPVD
jgi:hypothetical protein